MLAARALVRGEVVLREAPVVSHPAAEGLLGDDGGGS